jgi:hypothetical protein
MNPIVLTSAYSRPMPRLPAQRHATLPPPYRHPLR